MQIPKDELHFLFKQVLSMLPPYKGKHVLELGAGIGRFTGELAKDAGQVLALDFIESVIKKVILICPSKFKIKDVIPY